MPDWVKKKHRKYKELRERNQYVWDLYSGQALSKARDRAQRIAKEEGLELDDEGRFQPKDFGRRPDLGRYLFRRAQGENPDAFSERARISKYPPHFAQIVDRHVGAVQLAGYKTNRWTTEEGEGPLGNPNEDGSVVDHLMDNADGDENSWQAVQTKALKHIFLFLRGWALVDGRTEEMPRPRVIILNPESVTNWRMQGGRLVDVILSEEVDSRDSIQDDSETETRFIHYNLQGWQRFNEDGEPITERVEYDNPLWETEDRARRILPIVRTDLGFDRDLPHNIATDQEYVYNQLSDIRMMLRLTAHPKLQIDADDQQYDETIQELLRGSNVFNAEGASWLVPDYNQIGAAYDQYKAEVQEMYQTAFQQLENEARQKTATEITQKDQRGRQAFLVHLSDRADEFENAVRWRLAQLEAPGSPAMWSVPHVERSRDYAPVDPDMEAQSLKDLYFPNQAVPASEATKKEAAMEIAELQGIPEEDEEDLETAISLGQGRPSDQRMARLRRDVNAQRNGGA